MRAIASLILETQRVQASSLVMLVRCTKPSGRCCFLLISPRCVLEVAMPILAARYPRGVGTDAAPVNCLIGRRLDGGDCEGRVGADHAAKTREKPRFSVSSAISADTHSSLQTL